MKLTQVTFTRLHEVEGVFGQEFISAGGGCFPKYLILSYNLKTNTVVFPLGWKIEKGGVIPRENRRDDSVYQFRFGDFCHTVLQLKYVKKVDFVKVEYSPDEFQPNKKFGLLTLRIPRRNKARTDKLVKKYQTAKVVSAIRSKESNKVVNPMELNERTFPQYVYELVIQKSKWHDFAKELYEQNLVPKTDRFAILLTGPLFPRQLANFKQN